MNVEKLRLSLTAALPISCRSVIADAGGFLLGPSMVRTSVSSALREAALGLYLNPHIPLTATIRFLGLTRSGFDRRRQEWEWPARDVTRWELPAADSATVAPSDIRKAALALVALAQRKIDQAAQDETAAPDKLAKILADCAKALTTAQAILKDTDSKGQENNCDDDDARSLPELHAELAGYLERLVAEEEVGGGDGLLL